MKGADEQSAVKVKENIIENARTIQIENGDGYEIYNEREGYFFVKDDGVIIYAWDTVETRFGDFVVGYCFYTFVGSPFVLHSSFWRKSAKSIEATEQSLPSSVTYELDHGEDDDVAVERGHTNPDGSPSMMPDFDPAEYAGYNNAGALKQYMDRMHKETEVNSGALVQCEKFTDAISHLAVHATEPTEFLRMYNKYYRWKTEYSRVHTDDEEVRDTKTKIVGISEQVRQDPSPVATDWRCCLELRSKGKNGKFCDWVYIARSTIRNGRLGLFAARVMPKNVTIGWYAGEVTYHHPIAGTYAPTDAYLDDLHKPPIRNEYSTSMRDDQGRSIIVTPRGIGIGPGGGAGSSLFMGMHYMNSYTLLFQAGSTDHESAKRKQNTQMLDDGRVIAIKKIEADTELFTGYCLDDFVEKEDAKAKKPKKPPRGKRPKSQSKHELPRAGKKSRRGRGGSKLV